MNKEEKDIGKIMEEMLNRPLELIEGNKKLKKKIDKLQKENAELKIGITGIEISRDTLVEDIKELKKEIDNLIKENHKHIDYIASMKKKQDDKIRTKIKELEKTKNYIISMYAIGILEELLGDE